MNQLTIVYSFQTSTPRAEKTPDLLPRKEITARSTTTAPTPGVPSVPMCRSVPLASSLTRPPDCARHVTWSGVRVAPRLDKHVSVAFCTHVSYQFVFCCFCLPMCVAACTHAFMMSYSFLFEYLFFIFLQI